MSDNMSFSRGIVFELILTISICSDYDYMYKKYGQLEVKLLEETLHAVHDSEGSATINVLISNTNDFQITLVGGILILFNENGVEVTQHPVYAIDSYVGADFKIGLQHKTEVVGRLYVGFSSSEPLQLEIY